MLVVGLGIGVFVEALVICEKGNNTQSNLRLWRLASFFDSCMACLAASSERGFNLAKVRLSGFAGSGVCGLGETRAKH